LLRTDIGMNAGNIRPRVFFRRQLLFIFLSTILSTAMAGFSTGAGRLNLEGAGPAGPIIDSVEIRSENVFDLAEPKYDNFLFRLANKTHFVTRPGVIRRELLLKKGDMYDTALVSETVRNLRALPFLLKTEIRLDTGRGGESIMVVNTSDKWTTTGGVSFHRTGGRDDLRIGIKENNFLGYGIFMSHNFLIVENDRDYYQVEMSDNRVWGKGVSATLFYSDNPRAGQIRAVLGRPHYSLRQKFGGGILVSRLNSRFDYYIAEILVAQERQRKQRAQVQVSYRIGPPHLKVHFVPEYEYAESETRGRNVYDSSAWSFLPPAVQDSLTHSFKVSFRVQQIKYAVFERISRFHKAEDVNLGLDASITVGRALGSNLKRREFDFFSWWPQYTLGLGHNLIIFGAKGEHWQSDGRQIRRDINGYLIGYHQYWRRQTLAYRISLTSNRLRERSYTLYLDEDHGLRGFPAFAFNGEERLIINIENRYFSTLEILSVGIGGVAFADIGNIWTRDAEPKMRKTRVTFGVGLRLGVSRSTQAEVVRIDVAYSPERRNWQISFGTGQFF